jgi:hypothetical protein
MAMLRTLRETLALFTTAKSTLKALRKLSTTYVTPSQNADESSDPEEYLVGGVEL